MNTPVVSCSMLGRFGNQVMQYLFARAHAERIGARFYCESWIGEEIFDIPKHGKYDFSSARHAPGVSLVRRSEMDLDATEGDVEIRGYAQSDRAMIYTREWARGILKLRLTSDDVFNTLETTYAFYADTIVGHLRRGDYFGYGYPVVSAQSFLDCVNNYGLFISSPGEAKPELRLLTEENPTPHGNLPPHLSFLPDFYRMIHAPILLRSNSTFSWVAGLLNQGRVFAPVIDGLLGGKEHDCKFIEANWPRLSNLAFCTDLRLKGES